MRLHPTLRLVAGPAAVAGLALAFLAVPTFTAAQEQGQAQQAGDAQAAPFPDNWFFNGRPDAYKEMVGKPAPELALDKFHNVEGFTNEDLQGKITVVDIWATWCGPCIAAIPKNNEIAEKYGDQGVQVVGVTTSQGQERLPQAVQQHNIQYPVAQDPGEKTGRAWQVAFFPTYAIVDRKGIVRGVGLTPNHVEDAVKKILEEQPMGEAQAAAR